jgi:cold shock CspA family protein
MAQGRIHWYSKELGYGFVLSGNGATKYLVRSTEIASGEEDTLENNDEVTYELSQGREGQEATKVRKV